jgi:hypothetical protein
MLRNRSNHWSVNFEAQPVFIVVSGANVMDLTMDIWWLEISTVLLWTYQLLNYCWVIHLYIPSLKTPSDEIKPRILLPTRADLPRRKSAKLVAKVGFSNITTRRCELRNWPRRVRRMTTWGTQGYRYVWADRRLFTGLGPMYPATLSPGSSMERTRTQATSYAFDDSMRPLTWSHVSMRRWPKSNNLLL